jgi:hypothetical protein
MLVHVLKECQCLLSFWHDRNWGDRWKNDAWEKREQQETLKAGLEIKAVTVRPSATNQDRCDIDVAFMEDMMNCYLDVPRDCIEIVEGGQEQTAAHRPTRTRR